jgi:hypothetical protein
MDALSLSQHLLSRHGLRALECPFRPLHSVDREQVSDLNGGELDPLLLLINCEGHLYSYTRKCCTGMYVGIVQVAEQGLDETRTVKESFSIVSIRTTIYV